MTQIDLSEAILRPSDVFAAPEHVLASHFSQAEKIQILEAWELDLMRLQASDDENMMGDEGDLLHRVHDTLTLLRRKNETT